MEHNVPLLSICIPTYNRAELLKLSLEKNLPIISKFNLPIIIGDNSDNDQTKQVVEKIQKEYHFVEYYKHECNLGADKNIEFVLKNSISEYSWIIGDGQIVNESYLVHLMDVLHTKKYDLIVNNVTVNRVKNILESKVYTDANLLLIELGWHMTFLYALIFSRKLIKSTQYERFYNTNFLQHGIIFEYLVQCNSFAVLWEPAISCSAIAMDKNNHWFPSLVWEIFGKNWFCHVMALPFALKYESKLLCIKAHDDNCHLFGIKTLVRMRIAGFYSYKIYKQYYCYVEYITSTPDIMLKIISVIPKFLLRFMIYLHSIIRIL